MERRGSPETFFFKSTPSRQVLYFTCASQFIVTLRSVCPHLTSEPDQEVKCHWGSPSFRESLGLWLHADPPPHTHTRTASCCSEEAARLGSSPLHAGAVHSVVTAVDRPPVMEATVSPEGLSGWLKPQKHALEHMGSQEPLRVPTAVAAKPLTSTGGQPVSTAAVTELVVAGHVLSQAFWPPDSELLLLHPPRPVHA